MSVVMHRLLNLFEPPFPHLWIGEWCVLHKLIVRIKSWYIWNTWHRAWNILSAQYVLAITLVFSPRLLWELNEIINIRCLARCLLRSKNSINDPFLHFSSPLSAWKIWWFLFWPIRLALKGVTKDGTASHRISESKCWDKGLSCNNPTMLLSVCHPSCFSRQPFLMSTQPVNLSVTWHVAIYTHKYVCMHPVPRAFRVKFISAQCMVYGKCRNCVQA